MAEERKRKPGYCIAIITCPSEKEAVKIKGLLLDSRLAACVNIIKRVDSFFRWQGKMEDVSEVVLLAKTTRRKFKEIVRRVTEVHPYDVPEIIAVPIIDGNKPYLDWIDDSLKSP
jgi:periplasmic divalent cation tolerance protein